MQSIKEKLMYHIRYRMGEYVNCCVVVFSEKLGVLIQSENVECFLEQYHNK